MYTYPIQVNWEIRETQGRRHRKPRAKPTTSCVSPVILGRGCMTTCVLPVGVGRGSTTTAVLPVDVGRGCTTTAVLPMDVGRGCTTSAVLPMDVGRGCMIARVLPVDMDNTRFKHGKHALQTWQTRNAKSYTGL